MKGNCLTFDSFGQWFEHEGNKMRWMEKVGGSEGQGLAGRPKWVAGRPPTPSFTTFFSNNMLFSSTTTTSVHNGRAMATWAGRLATFLGRLTTPWHPYKRACQGDPPPSSHKLTSIAKVSESFSKFQLC
jgi:hypothetical protein